MNSATEDLRELIRGVRGLLQEESRGPFAFLEAIDDVSFFNNVSAAVPKRQAQPAPAPAVVPVQQALPARTILRRRPNPAPVSAEQASAERKSDLEKPQLEKNVAQVTADLSPVRATLAEALPGLRLLANPPDDSEARLLATQWLRKQAATQILILANSVTPLLANLARALSIQCALARVVAVPEIDKQLAWERLLASEEIRVILLPARLLKDHAVLQSAYSGDKLRDRIAVITMEESERYVADPTLKAALWQQLSQTLPLFVN